MTSVTKNRPTIIAGTKNDRLEKYGMLIGCEINRIWIWTYGTGEWDRKVLRCCMLRSIAKTEAQVHFRVDLKWPWKSWLRGSLAYFGKHFFQKIGWVFQDLPRTRVGNKGENDEKMNFENLWKFSVIELNRSEDFGRLIRSEWNQWKNLLEPVQIFQYGIKHMTYCKSCLLNAAFRLQMLLASKIR